MKLVEASTIPAGWGRTQSGVVAPAGAIRPPKRKPPSQIAFEGAEDSRWTKDWLTPETSPIELIGRYQAKMRDRVRALARNAPWLVGLKRTWVDNVIGAANGWKLQAKSYDDELGEKLNERRNKRMELWWRRWTLGVDINRRESLVMFMRVGEEEYAEVGEYFIIKRPVNDGRVVPLALELLPAERLDPTFERPAARTLDGRRVNRISNGIEFDADGRRIAYHFSDIDQWGAPNAMLPKLRIKTHRVLHRFLKLRAGQERGIPPLFAAILLLRDFDDAMEFEMEAWQSQARIVGGIKHRSAGIIPSGQERDDVDERPVHRIHGAAFLDLGIDEDMVFPNATRPNDKLDPFMTFALRTLGKTVGWSYQATTGDYSKVNFASGKLAEIADQFTSRRNQTELHHLNLRPIYDEFVFLLVTGGKIDVQLLDFIQDPDRYTEHSFIYPGRPHADPAKEVTAAALRILVGLSTLADEAAALGKDWEANLQQIAREIRRMEDLGIPRITVGGSAPLTGRGNSGFEPSGEEGEGDDEEESRARAEVGTTVELDRDLIRALVLARSDDAHE